MIIYLDSQDYSHIAAPPSGKEAFFASLARDLTSLVDRGDIEIRYSAIHISEMAHVSAAHMKFSVPRTQVLRDFCRGKCMRYWQFIAEDEVLANFGQRQVAATNDSDQWFETDLTAIGNFADRFKQELEKKLRERGANRRTRRMASKRINIGRYLTETEAGKVLIQNFANLLNEKFSLAKSISIDALREYATGSIEVKKFQQYLRGIMFDPIHLIAHLSPEFDTEGKLPKIVRDQGIHLVETLNPTLEKIAHRVPAIPRGSLYDDIWRDIRMLPDKTAIGIRRKLIQSMIADHERLLRRERIDEARLDALQVPVADTLAGILGRFLKQALSAAEAGRRIRLFKLSDAPDLFHATYIPHVDIFRCDSAWTDFLSPEGRKYGVDVVGKIEDLLPTILHRLTHLRSKSTS